MGLELYTQPSQFINGLSATTFFANSARIDVVDIVLYELSGFEVTGNVSVSGIVSSESGIFNALSVGGGNINNLVNNSFSGNSITSQDIESNTLFVTSMTAQTALFEKFLGQVEIGQLLQSSALTGQTIIYTDNGWVPADLPNLFPGTRLHDFQLTSYDTGFQLITADTSYCGVAPSGSLISDPVWRIIRLKYNDAGLVYEQGITVTTAWTARYTASYSLF
jgi:hypothetical protein